MSQAIPTVQTYMTPSPHTIGAEQTLAKAHALLREHQIRHLPVLRGGQLVGMITQRDLALAEALISLDTSLVLVADAMTPEAYSVAPDAPLDEVVKELAEHKYGSAVVVKNDKVVGIFTLVDVCTAFAELLQGRFAR